MNCTCGITCRSELFRTAADNGSVVEVRPSSICSISLLVASTKIAGNSFVSGSIWNLIIDIFFLLVNVRLLLLLYKYLELEVYGMFLIKNFQLNLGKVVLVYSEIFY